jgi:uroporphyrinogen-III synthase
MAKPIAPSHWTFISLRPQNQHAATRRAVVIAGGKFVACASFALQTVACETLQTAMACTIRIASSPAAVKFTQQQAPISGHWFAIGKSTANALLRAGAHSVVYPKIADADHLLELPEFTHLSRQSVALFTAPGGRNVLERELQQRAKLFQLAHVYQRRARILTSKQKATLRELPAQTVLLVTSQQAFQHFWQQLDAALQQKFIDAPCVASSERLLNYLETLGFKALYCSNGTQPGLQVQCFLSANL